MESRNSEGGGEIGWSRTAATLEETSWKTLEPCGNPGCPNPKVSIDWLSMSTTKAPHVGQLTAGLSMSNGSSLVSF